MAENAPPAGAANAGTDASRGMPYYEKLRRDLRESLHKKRQIDTNLAQIEETILRAETSYLEETSAGNIIKGFDNYIKGATATSTTSGPGTATRRKAPISDADRIFSRSSASFMREASTPGSTQTTPSHAPTPTSSFPTRESSQPTPNGPSKSTAVASKKKKAPDTDEDTDGKPAKRGKITYGRD
ncbi:NuA4-domain-containing protein [Lindgomyces ingoldianus]|uniref:NuA4-domain-containing protein n=1 Tax=Lindgomyces ingoldianus TaxID=673940 RepID=A0ACB6QNU3_9PLEO|nr:NuA4-domain-containing protein [Lindgomyces ingoldianus]KAF2468205.1 NuA4-domain-containing protein [Lindgomyces ingoldianus]